MSRNKRILIFIFSIAVYAAGFILIDHTAGKGPATIAVIPAIVAGWLFGFWPAVITGILMFPCNALMISLVCPSRFAELFGGGGMAGSPAIVIIGAIVGRLRDLSVRLRIALAERFKAEEELKKHRDNLELLVQERTAQLQETTNRLERLIETSLDPIVISRQSGVLSMVNPAFLNIIGYSKEEVLGKTAYSFAVMEPGVYESATGEAITINDDFFEEARKMTEQLYAQGSISNWITYYKNKNGTIFPVSSNIVMLNNDSGENLGSFAILRDITQQRKAELSLLSAKAAAETANEAKTSFLATMSHELRTPLNAVIGFTDMLADTHQTPEQEEFTETIQQSGEALLSLVNNILDFSKMEGENISFEEIDFDIEILVHEACEVVRPGIFGKEIELICSISEALPSLVKGDPRRYRQVLVNLMSNAAKFTEHGEIEISLALDREAGGEYLIHAIIRDTGIGIPADKLEAIFDVFQQADGSTTRRYGGAGLGLSIARKIARTMGGDIWVESTPNQGSLFHFTACLKHADAVQPGRFPPADSLIGKRVLIAEDNKTNRDILVQLLKSAGMQVEAVRSGDQALSLVLDAHASGQPFAICVFDISLPNLDGYGLAREIRKAIGNDLPLLAFTADIAAGARPCQDAGYNGFLPKPVKRAKLFKMLERLLTPLPAPNQAEAKPAASIVTQHSMSQEAKHTTCILLAEDNPVNQKLAAVMLAKAGYQVAVADNGKIAVAMFCASPDAFDIIFMDMQMPEMSGLDATETIRAKGFTRIPIVAMTANAMPGDRERCLAAGMNDYIAKPIKRDVVFEKLKAWVFERSITQPAAAQPAPAERTPSESTRSN